MPIIVSSSTHWKGTVTLADYFNHEQVTLIEDAFTLPEEFKDQPEFFRSVMDKKKVTAILKCATEWRIVSAEDQKIPAFPDPVTAETFPYTPRSASSQFIEWLFSEVKKIYFGELEIPNALGLPRTDMLTRKSTPPATPRIRTRTKTSSPPANQEK